ncbi:hypothetical protein D8666_08270 [Ochrobactrum soli]|nr:hypothetical protein D8666_08270 [[Ochrobactrum] soli]
MLFPLLGRGFSPGNRFEAVGTRFDRDNRIDTPTVCFQAHLIRKPVHPFRDVLLLLPERRDGDT